MITPDFEDIPMNFVDGVVFSILILANPLILDLIVKVIDVLSHNADFFAFTF